ncbi:MAG: DUF2220 family protein [Gordonibacter sp.]
MATSMLSVCEARKRAKTHYDRYCREWASTLFMQVALTTPPDNGANRAEPGHGSSDPTGLDRSNPESSNPEFSLALHVPTEKTVLANPAAARAWARSWQDLDSDHHITWVQKSWPSVGDQRLPQKLLLRTPNDIASFAQCKSAWDILKNRTAELAALYRREQATCNDSDPAASGTEGAPAEGTIAGSSTAKRTRAKEAPIEIAPAFKKAALLFPQINYDDWNKLLAVLSWLVQHPDVACYARELPIRGIDTKWVERHRKVTELLLKVFTGRDSVPFQLRAPAQIRVRFLDESLAPGGLRDLSASPAELNRYTGAPELVILCENLISLMTLPSLDGALGIHGGGYGVSELASLAWLQAVPVLYWGDLDSHGFAILSQWRHHHTRTESLMMDEKTFAAHQDLCVNEPTPSRARLSYLTPSEEATLKLLQAQGDVRLEQERIEWSYAQAEIESAVTALKKRLTP